MLDTMIACALEALQMANWRWAVFKNPIIISSLLEFIPYQDAESARFCEADDIPMIKRQVYFKTLQPSHVIALEVFTPVSLLENHLPILEGKHWGKTTLIAVLPTKHPQNPPRPRRMQILPIPGDCGICGSFFLPEIRVPSILCESL